MCRLLVSNLERVTHRVLNVVIGTPKPLNIAFICENIKDIPENRGINMNRIHVFCATMHLTLSLVC